MADLETELGTEEGDKLKDNNLWSRVGFHNCRSSRMKDNWRLLDDCSRVKYLKVDNAGCG